MSLAHVEEAKKAWEEYNTGNISAVFDRYAEDVVVHFSGRHRFSRDVTGKEALLDYFVEFTNAFPGFHMEPHAIMGDEDHVVTLVKMTYVHEDASHTDNMVVVSHVGPEGKIVEEWYQDGDQYAVDEFVGRFYPPQ
jgi:ketosteroid isomerase-like protein